MEYLSAAAVGNQTMAYFGHHKCASMWILHVLKRVAIESGIRYHVVNDHLTPQAVGPLSDSRGEFTRRDLRDRVEKAHSDLVLCLAADRDQAANLNPHRAFHVIRDPRDIIVSAYFSHRNSHPTHGRPHLQAHRKRLQAMSLEEGLFLEMAFSRTELLQLAGWDYGNPNTLELKMEELTLHPYAGFLRIFRHLGFLGDTEPTQAREQIPAWMFRLLNRLSHRPGLRRLRRRIHASSELVLGTVYAQRFELWTGGRMRGAEDVMNHYRKGIAGDWVNYFTPDHVEEFNSQFGDLLIRLGYEESLRHRPDRKTRGSS